MCLFISLLHEYLQIISSTISTVSSVSQVVVLVASLFYFSLLSRFNFKQQQKHKDVGFFFPQVVTEHFGSKLNFSLNMIITPPPLMGGPGVP